MLFRYLVALLLVLGAASALAAGEMAARHVVIISVDGFPAYLLDDPKAPIPNVRRLARAGVAAAGMRVVNPSVTWPNHTSLVTGVKADKHGVLANGILTRHGTGEPVTIEAQRDQAELVHVPTLFDVAHQAGLSTAAINWPCTRNSKSLDDNFPDVPKPCNTPRLDCAKNCRPPACYRPTSKSSTRVPAACSVIASGPKPRGSCSARKPSLTLLHLLNVDAIHHKYGPQTPDGYLAIGAADAYIGQVLEAISAAGIRDQTAVFVVADHGFMLTPKAQAQCGSAARGLFEGRTWRKN